MVFFPFCFPWLGKVFGRREVPGRIQRNTLRANFESLIFSSRFYLEVNVALPFAPLATSIYFPLLPSHISLQLCSITCKLNLSRRISNLSGMLSFKFIMCIEILTCQSPLDSTNKMYSLFRVPKLHFNPQVHTERLIVFLAFRKDFLMMSYGDLLHYDKKKNRDELLKSFDPQYIEQHLHGISFKHMCDLVKDMWTARYFHPNSEITRFFEGASFERQQDPAFRRLINVPPLGEALESDIWRLNHQPYYKPRITKSGRIRKLHSTRLRFLPSREPFGPDLMLNFSPESGPFQPFLGPYEDDYECSTALPFALQHSILTTLQDLTEESLFSFASRYFPGYLALNFKTCPKSMELNTWRSHLHMNAPYIRQNLTSGFIIDDLHFFLHRLETITDLIVRRKQGK